MSHYVLIQHSLYICMYTDGIFVCGLAPDYSILGVHSWLESAFVLHFRLPLNGIKWLKGWRGTGK